MKVITKGVKKGATRILDRIPIIGDIVDVLYDKKTPSQQSKDKQPQQQQQKQQNYANVQKSKTGRMILQANNNAHWTPSFYGGSFG